MSAQGLLRRLLGKLLQLPPRGTGSIQIDRDIPVPMRDGVVLMADHYYGGQRPAGPVVLIRSSYGRGKLFGLIAGLLAERGFQVLAQSVRGTTGSGGKLDPMRQEQADGADTVDWVRARPWFTGKLFTFGPSYLGNVQWAIANGSGDKLDGLVQMMTLSNFRDETLGSGGFTLAGSLGWTQLMQGLAGNEADLKRARPRPGDLDHVFSHLPLGTIDQAAFGTTVTWWRDWVRHDDPEDPWWHAIDHGPAVAELRAPVTMVAGWQDIFLPFQLKDFEARQAAGRDTWITIGPWNHSAPGGMVEGLRQAITFFSALAAQRRPFPDRDRVRLFLQGAGVWRDYPSWPPPGGQSIHLFLGSGGILSDSAPDEEASDGYTYDPADPTPAIHGPQVMGGKRVRDMKALEERADTLVYTGAALARDLDAIGPVQAELFIRSDRDHTDFYVCLCDVDKKGRSLQVVDGYVRLRPGKPALDASGVREVTIDCWPTAYRFKRGHKLRLIVASGAHPRYARNLGTGEPLATATTMVPAQQEILQGGRYPSSVCLRGTSP